MVINIQNSDGDVIGVVFQKVDLICDQFLQPLDKKTCFFLDHYNSSRHRQSLERICTRTVSNKVHVLLKSHV